MNKEYLETIKCFNGEVYHLEYHQKRYESVLTALGIARFQRLSDVVCAPKKGLYRCRVLYSSEALEVSYYPYTKRDIQKLKIVVADDLEYSKKYADRRELQKLFALKEEADDVLIVQNSRITDTTIANIAFFNGERWMTPKYPLLEGTTRARLLKEGKIFEVDIFVEDIEKYEKVALLNAMIDFDIIAEENIKGTFC